MVKFDIEEETQTEFQTFLEENGSDIAEQVLHEYAEANIIVAIDDNGNVAKEFHSFDEIISYFNKSVDKYINLTNRLLRRFYRGFSNDLENVRNSLLCVIILSNNPCQKQR